MIREAESVVTLDTFGQFAEAIAETQANFGVPIDRGKHLISETTPGGGL
jgi:hypothetical protein